MVHDHAIPADLPDRIVELLLGPSEQPGPAAA
jgi:hypothetical protein